MSIKTKMQNATKALVKKYGEGTIVTSQQIQQVLAQLRKKNIPVPHLTYITCNKRYQKGRNQFRVTSKMYFDTWDHLGRGSKKAAPKASTKRTERMIATKAQKAPKVDMGIPKAMKAMLEKTYGVSISPASATRH